MPPKKKSSEPATPGGKIEPRDITEELRESYLDYAMSVIVSRALPDVRDGLKPVHRRILWTMWNMGQTAGARFVKSARITGEILGKYHPHGDTAVYDAMVRMAQDFSLRYPLVKGQGNFGCFTGDTKVKLTDGRSVSFKELIKEAKRGKKNYTYTFNHETRKIELAEIKKPRLTKKNTSLIKVTLDNEEAIKCTPNHKFMLRDGTYKEAQELKPQNSLMPGYMRLSEKKDDVHAVDYTMVYQPVKNEWDWTHRLADEWNIKNKVYARNRGRVRHHKDFNKTNNDPSNIQRMHWAEHWKLHANLASWRHENDPEYVKKIAKGREKFIKENPHVLVERARTMNKKLWASEKFRKEHHKRMQEMWSDKEYKERMKKLSSKTLKSTWQNKEYREMMSKLKSKELKKRWKEDSTLREYWIKRMREISNELWADPTHREYISKLGKERTSDPQWKAQQSKISKTLWQDPEYRAKYKENHFSEMAKKLWENPEIKKFYSKRAKKQWNDPAFRTKMTELIRATGKRRAQENPEHFKKMTAKARVSLKKLWQNPEYKKRVMRSKVLGYAHSLLEKHETLTPEIYKQERTNNGIPCLESALEYFNDFEEIREKAPLYNHTVVATETLSEREDVYDLTIDGTHNFLLDAGIFVHNSVDGDAAAHMRYTEAKLEKIAEELLFDIEKETVEWGPTYDNSRKEPKCLPAKLPNLLLNGTAGIAVGMATSIPPHNLDELANAISYLIDNPDASIADLMQFIPGPDFPTGGVIYDRRAMEEAYATGKGSITTRAIADIQESKGKVQIIITEIPYQVNKADLITKMAELVTDKRIEGIKDIRDESDREGMRIAIDLKGDAPPQKILNRLYQMTDLQKNIHLNMIALVGGLQPQTLSLKDILQEHIEHRKVVIRRRTEFDLKKAKERAHILEGLVKAIDIIDKVIAAIRKSKDRDTAKANLMQTFKFTELQANAILEMRLAALAALERKKLEDELKEKKVLIGELEAILKAPKKILGIIKSDLAYLQKTYPSERRTKVKKGGVKEFSQEDLVPQEEVVITLTRGGYIKRMPSGTFKAQKRGGKGLIGAEVKEEDLIQSFLSANTHDSILFFTNRGRVFRTRVYEVPAASRTAKGRTVYNFLEIPPEEHVTAVVAHPVGKGGETTDTAYLVMVTRHGIVKRTPLGDFDNVRKNGIIAIGLKKDDELRWVHVSKGRDEVIIATTHGQAIRFKESDVRQMGRTAAGVAGIRLKGEDKVTGVGIIKKDGKFLVMMANGYGKQTPIKGYKVQKRGGSGMRTARVTKKTGHVMAVRVVDESHEEVIAFSSKGQVIRTEINAIRTAGRDTQGVKIMNLKRGDELVGIVCL